MTGSRTEASRLDPEPVDLDALVDDVLTALAVDREVHAHVDDLPTVEGRPGQLRQVMQNLISTR